MTLQNRVQPTGEIIATPERGTLMGNRGILHDDTQRLMQRRWQHPHWVTCVTKYKDWHREVMQPNNYTELFFLDEPTALAAGHRPCGLCRHTDYLTFKQRFTTANATLTLAEMDKRMQRDRVLRTRRQKRHSADARTLPDGTFILYQNQPHLIWEGAILRYSPAGYTDRNARPNAEVSVLTPACTVGTLAAGYRPNLHDTAIALL